MALIKLGGLAQDVRGSLNGTVFSRNKGGAYTRTKVSPVQPVSPYSSASRQAFKEASQSWASSLTEVERGAWIAFAAIHPFINVFGDSITLSGIAFFQAANKRLAGIGFPMIADAPITWDVTPPAAIAAVASVDGSGNMSLFINPTDAPSGPNISAYLFATTKIPNGARPQRNQYRLINPQDGVVRDETYDWGTDYQARFSPYTPAALDKIGLLYAYIDTDSGAISVASGEVVLASALPGPLVPIGAVMGIDQSGGNIKRRWITNVPHGMTGTPNVDIAGLSNGAYNGTAISVDVISPTIIQDSGVVTGSALILTAMTGTVQRVS